MNIYDFGFTQDDTGFFDLQVTIDFDNKIIDMFANGVQFSYEDLDNYFPNKEEQLELQEQIIKNNYKETTLDDFVSLIYNRFSDLAVIRTEKNALYQNEENIFYKGKIFKLDYKDIDNIYLDISKEKILEIKEEQEEYLEEVLEQTSSDFLLKSDYFMKLYYELFDPYDWYNSIDVWTFEEWKEWFFSKTNEEHFYNLKEIIKERESDLGKEEEIIKRKLLKQR